MNTEKKNYNVSCCNVVLEKRPCSCITGFQKMVLMCVTHKCELTVSQKFGPNNTRCSNST